MAAAGFLKLYFDPVLKNSSRAYVEFVDRLVSAGVVELTLSEGICGRGLCSFEKSGSQRFVVVLCNF